MAVTHGKKGLGRGLSALIPDADMEFLSRVARGDAPLAPVRPSKTISSRKVASPIKPQGQAPKAPGRKTTGGHDALAIRDRTSQAEIEPDRSPSGEIAQKTSAAAQEKPSDPPIVAPVLEVNAKIHEGINQSTVAATEGDSEVDAVQGHVTEWLDIALIKANPYQPRRTFSEQEMQDLATSIREHGVLQPILVRPVPPEANSPASQASYQLVAGERRWRAAQVAGLAQIPAIVRPVSDQQALELALIENVQRHDITPLDAALAYRRLSQEFSLSQDAVAQRVGKSRVAVANTLRLLDLPSEAQKAIEDGVLSEGHGRAILLASGDGARRAVFRRALREKLSVRATEDLARHTLNSADDESPGLDETHSEGENKSSTIARRKKNGNIKNSVEQRAVEDKLQKHFQTRVRLKTRAKGGQVIIEYFSQEDLDRIIRLLDA